VWGVCLAPSKPGPKSLRTPPCLPPPDYGWLPGAGVVLRCRKLTENVCAPKVGEEAHLRLRTSREAAEEMSLFMERGVNHSSPLWLLVGLEPSSFARISHDDQHRQGHEDRESDLDPSVDQQVHVHLLYLAFGNQPASSLS